MPVNKKIVGSIYLGISQIITSSNNNSCALQLGGIEPSNNILSTSSISTTSSVLPNYPTVTITATPENSPNDSKFAATTVPLGTLFLTSAATTFYYRSK